jgi:uncharacterized protein (TIGR02145 family)
MEKIIVAAIGLFSLAALNGQAVEQRLPVAEEISNRRTSFNMEEIKVRWKKAALENCTGVPCVAFTCGFNTVADIDGNTYNTVLIGTQCWTKENLKVTKYNDGTNIPLDASGGTTGDGAGETWSSRTTGARTVYGHDNTNLSIYGYLYNWYAVSDSRKICPIGWHVPTDTEWETMGDLLGGRATIAGKLKQTGTTLWTTQGPGTDNSSEFTALPGGRRQEFSNGSFSSIRNSAYFWTANPATSPSSFASGPSAFDRNPDHNNARLFRTNRGAAAGFSVRCIKD